jgi:hypothetical protein
LLTGCQASYADTRISSVDAGTRDGASAGGRNAKNGSARLSGGRGSTGNTQVDVSPGLDRLHSSSSLQRPRLVRCRCEVGDEWTLDGPIFCAQVGRIGWSCKDLGRRLCRQRRRAVSARRCQSMAHGPCPAHVRMNGNSLQSQEL